MISSFFKTPRPRRFNFQARYYDENKEEMQERYARIKAEVEGEKEGGSLRRVDFRSQWVKQKKTTNFEKKSNIRLLFIFILLCAICYYILYL